MSKLAPMLPLSLCLVAAALLAGCSRGVRNDCNKPQLYAQAPNQAPLRIPAGLDAANTRASLRIPELNQPEPPARKLSDSCLDEPPRFNPNARLLPAPAKGAKAADGKAAEGKDEPRKRWWWPFGDKE